MTSPSFLSRLLPTSTLIVEECLRPVATLYQGQDYSGANAIEIKTARGEGSVEITIPETNSYNSAVVPVGEIFDRLKFYPESAIQNAARSFLVPIHRETMLHFLELAPFCLCELATRDTLLGRARGSFENILILYRLSEIFLAAIELLREDAEGQGGQFQVPGILLLRQRYLYLAQLSPLSQPPDYDLNKFVSGYSIRIRRARQAYADILLNEEDRALLAFAEVENGHRWNLDGEVTLLICSFTRRQKTTNEHRSEIIPLELSPIPWPFAREIMADHILTDVLLRRWFLAHDNLRGLSFCLPALYHGLRFIERLAAKLVVNIYALAGIGLLLFLAGFAFPQTTLFPLAGILLGLLLPLVLLCALFFSKKPLSARQALYPLALRVPAMGLVGVLAIAGLMDPLVRFTLNGFDRFLPALFIFGTCMAAALAYIFFEVQTRTLVLGQAIRRAVYLGVCGLVSTLWLAAITGWLVDTIAISHCSPDDMAAGVQCVLVAPYGEVLQFTRHISLFGERISLDYLLLVGALALLVGVFTQIFWEDKAIAEPL